MLPMVVFKDIEHYVAYVTAHMYVVSLANVPDSDSASADVPTYFIVTFV